MTDLAYTRHYDEVFSALLDYTLASMEMPIDKIIKGEWRSNDETLNKIKKGWPEKQWPLFELFVSEISRLYQQHSSLYQSPDEKRSPGWFDPWGSIYESISSKWKTSAMGQFFTPENICTFMAKIVGVSTPEKGYAIINEPCAGSGRLPMAAFYEHIQAGIPAAVSAQDLDLICCKMTLCNFAGNGVGGEVVHCDSLAGNEAVRRSWMVMPVMGLIPEELQSLYKLILTMQFGPTAWKMYTWQEVPNESTLYWHTNVRLEKEWEERKDEREKISKEEFLQEARKQMAESLNGSLFEGSEEIITQDIEVLQKKNGNLPMYIGTRPVRKLPKKAEPEGQQTTLF
jgi:hypothetical protein